MARGVRGGAGDMTQRVPAHRPTLEDIRERVKALGRGASGNGTGTGEHRRRARSPAQGPAPCSLRPSLIGSPSSLPLTTGWGRPICRLRSPIPSHVPGPHSRLARGPLPGPLDAPVSPPGPPLFPHPWRGGGGHHRQAGSGPPISSFSPVSLFPSALSPVGQRNEKEGGGRFADKTEARGTRTGC